MWGSRCRYEGHSDSVLALCTSDNNLLYSGSFDHTIRLWNMASLERVYVEAKIRLDLEEAAKLSTKKAGKGDKEGKGKKGKGKKGKGKKGAAATAQKVLDQPLPTGATAHPARSTDPSELYRRVGAHGVYDVVITTTWATDNQPFLIAAMGLRVVQHTSVEVLEVVTGSAADFAGVLPGDLIVRVDEDDIGKKVSFLRALERLQGTVVLTVHRTDNVTMHVSVMQATLTLDQPSAASAGFELDQKQALAWLGDLLLVNTSVNDQLFVLMLAIAKYKEHWRHLLLRYGSEYKGGGEYAPKGEPPRISLEAVVHFCTRAKIFPAKLDMVNILRIFQAVYATHPVFGQSIRSTTKLTDMHNPDVQLTCAQFIAGAVRLADTVHVATPNVADRVLQARHPHPSTHPV
jgi:hypothetical protein